MSRPPEILVVAGVNGAGKSSIAGAALRQRGAVCYDPDRATQRYLEAGLPANQANARAWRQGRDQLERAVRRGRSFALETTLGGRTITRLLMDAAAGPHRVRCWYVGLESVALHLDRVRARVARGGHDIPEAAIRARWDASRANLIRLIPHLDELSLHDNSVVADPAAGATPTPRRLLHARAGAIRFLAAPERYPPWAKPIAAAALECWRMEF